MVTPSAYPLPLNQAIERNPLTVAPDTPAREAIALMNRAQASSVIVVWQQYSEIPEGLALSRIAEATPPGEPFLGEDAYLVGIFTEQDVVRVTALGIDLEGVTIAAVMSQPVVTLKESETQDIFTVLNLFTQHQIRHLPIVDSLGTGV